MNIRFFVFFVLIFLLNCENNSVQQEENVILTSQNTPKEIIVGAARLDQYLPIIQQGTGALMVNHTSVLGEQHLVDSLLKLDVNIKHIFAPEHGFRGTADAGQKIKDGLDEQTGLPVISLYGKKKEPTALDLEGIDWIIFDIQDVGARFYTYISSMHYLMQACAKFSVPIIILDRPNPNGHYVDGPLLEEAYQSFVGMHPIPVVHGMTVGELAQMINGEGWLKGQLRCDLKVIPCGNYTHQRPYNLPIKPSPNLPNNRAIYLYPSLCFFEGTVVSVGRGTQKQFQLIGHPLLPMKDFSFTPVPMPGAQYPKHENKLCYGIDLSDVALDQIWQMKRLDLSYLINAYQAFPDKDQFFLESNFFDKLAGTNRLQRQIKSGLSEDKIRSSWEKGLSEFKTLRRPYLLYEE